MTACCETMIKIPRATLSAFVLLIFGMGLFMGPLIAIGEKLSANELLNFDGYIRYCYQLLKPIIICVTSAMVGMGLFFLFVSVLLGSGKRRKRIFWGTKRHLCAQILNSFVFLFCYLLLISWFIIACALLYPASIAFYFKYIDCANKNLCSCATNLLFEKTSTKAIDGTNRTTEDICNYRKPDICNQVDMFFVSFLLSFIGSFLIMLSFIHFLISMSSNHAYIKTDKPCVDANGMIESRQVIEETKM